MNKPNNWEQVVEEWVRKFYYTIPEDYEDEKWEPGFREGEEPTGVKIIFDGYGLAEEYDYNDRTFRKEDGVVMVMGENYSDWSPLSESDTDYPMVSWKLDQFEEYANDDGPCNPESMSFAVFVHKDSLDIDEFPEHDFTPWCLIHRPSEEICIHVWYNLDHDEVEVLDFEDNGMESELDPAEMKELIVKIWQRDNETIQ